MSFLFNVLLLRQIGDIHGLWLPVQYTSGCDVKKAPQLDD
jgi:hypothetical protein